MKNIFILLVGYILVCEYSVYSRKNTYVKPIKVHTQTDSDDNPGDKLFLTPLIQSGKIEKARELALVRHLTHVRSYSGFFTVNPEYNGNMYFWFFPAAINAKKAPLLVWLQGGPGYSSMYGLFVENGPFIIDVNNNIHFRKTAWTLTHSVIYFDNPVGTGFSFTDNGGFVKNEKQVARDLYEALIQFFTLFPEYQSRDFYMTGESYAGKYVPAISYKIHKENQNSPKIHINFKGMAIGSSFSDPENMINYGEDLYKIGLLDRKQLHYFQQEEKKTRKFIKNSEWLEAFETMDILIEGDLYQYGTYFQNTTGLSSLSNFLIQPETPEDFYFSSFLEQNYVRRAIHVGNASYVLDSSEVLTFLREDFYKSVRPWIEVLLDAEESYKILIYSGQLDLSVPFPETDNMANKLQWNGADEFANTTRKIWRAGGPDVVGYVKTTRTFIQLLFRNAGHLVPTDQPEWAFDMINTFTAGKPFA